MVCAIFRHTNPSRRNSDRENGFEQAWHEGIGVGHHSIADYSDQRTEAVNQNTDDSKSGCDLLEERNEITLNRNVRPNERDDRSKEGGSNHCDERPSFKVRLRKECVSVKRRIHCQTIPLFSAGVHGRPMADSLRPVTTVFRRSRRGLRDGGCGRRGGRCGRR